MKTENPYNCALASKLRPDRFSGMSGKMAAIVGCIIGAKYTSPSLVELYVTSDGFLLGRLENDIGANEFLGSVAYLECNWKRLLDSADLTMAEKKLADRFYRGIFQ